MLWMCSEIAGVTGDRVQTAWLETWYHNVMVMRMGGVQVHTFTAATAATADTAAWGLVM